MIFQYLTLSIFPLSLTIFSVLAKEETSPEYNTATTMFIQCLPTTTNNLTTHGTVIFGSKL